MKSIINSALKSMEIKKIIANFISLSFIQGANYLTPLLILSYIVRIVGSKKFGLLYCENKILKNREC